MNKKKTKFHVMYWSMKPQSSLFMHSFDIPPTVRIFTKRRAALEFAHIVRRESRRVLCYETLYDWEAKGK